MKKVLIVAPGYPNKDNKYNNAFVHSRVLEYKKRGLNVEVFSLEKNNESEEIYEKVNILRGDYLKLEQKLKNNKYDRILVHFAFRKIMKTIMNNTKHEPIIVWVHGTEALGWYRRLFAFDKTRPHKFLGYIIYNVMQLFFMNQLINQTERDITFIFVSKWMKKILETDTFTKNKIKKYYIIPNVVDTKTFKLSEKEVNLRLNVLSIRSYSSKKYANDLAVKAVLDLSSKKFFNELTFTFIGDGKLFDKTLQPLKKFDNVIINKTFLNKQEIYNQHKNNGIMLIPTRQDAQGVSMCEAMSSGLIPITSNNTAIPEFVNKNVGYLTNNYKEISQAIEDLYLNKNKFKQMSKKTSIHIQKLCSENVVIEKELEIINN